MGFLPNPIDLFHFFVVQNMMTSKLTALPKPKTKFECEIRKLVDGVFISMFHLLNAIGVWQITCEFPI